MKINNNDNYHRYLHSIIVNYSIKTKTNMIKIYNILL